MQEEVRPTLADLTDAEILQAIGLRLLVLRKARRLDQKDIQTKIGINTSKISRWENGVGPRPDIATLLRLAEFYDVSPDWLFGELWRMRVLSKGEAPIWELIHGGGGRGELSEQGELNLFLSSAGAAQ